MIKLAWHAKEQAGTRVKWGEWGTEARLENSCRMPCCRNKDWWYAEKNTDLERNNCNALCNTNMHECKHPSCSTCAAIFYFFCASICVRTLQVKGATIVVNAPIYLMPACTTPSMHDLQQFVPQFVPKSRQERRHRCHRPSGVGCASTYFAHGAIQISPEVGLN
jgi:hypothetical protein